MVDVQKSSNNPPWVDLLDSLIEIIIEKLPAVDYIRFGIICKRWHSIQKEHRLRYAPKPPPTAPSVVLVNYQFYWCGFNWKNDKQLICHLPFEQKKYRLFLPYISPVIIIDSCCGWILTHRVLKCREQQVFSFSNDYFSIYNPVTHASVQLPLFPHRYAQNWFGTFPTIPKGTMSAPPTDPNCCIIISSIISTHTNTFVLRLHELVWEKVELSYYGDYASCFNEYVYVQGMFFRTSKRERKFLYIVDPFLPKPIEHKLELDIEEMIEYGDTCEKNLVAIDGKLFLVLHIRVEFVRKKFGVFRANLNTKKWMKVTNIGDYAILLSDSFDGKAISLPVNSFEGFEKNMIYFSQKFIVDDCIEHEDIMRFRDAWMTFDMVSEEVVEGLEMHG